MRKSSYKTNSWWHHRMVGSLGPDRDISTFEDKRQDAYLKKLEESQKPPRKKFKSKKSDS